MPANKSTESRLGVGSGVWNKEKADGGVMARLSTGAKLANIVEQTIVGPPAVVATHVFASDATAGTVFYFNTTNPDAGFDLEAPLTISVTRNGAGGAGFDYTLYALDGYGALVTRTGTIPQGAVSTGAVGVKTLLRMVVNTPSAGAGTVSFASQGTYGLQWPAGLGMLIFEELNGDVPAGAGAITAGGSATPGLDVRGIYSPNAVLNNGDVMIIGYRARRVDRNDISS